MYIGIGEMKISTKLSYDSLFLFSFRSPLMEIVDGK